MRLPGPLTEKEQEGVTKTLAYLRQQADASLTASLPHYAAALLLAHLDALAADRGRERAEKYRECQWSYRDYPAGDSDFEGKCGVVWSMNVGGIEENGVRFCPSCGGKVIPPTIPACCQECGEEVEAPLTLCDQCAEADEETDAARATGEGAA